ncbi:kinase-like domain-containing protein [Morchella snyderi]|nr:kinase-like domain-containing protein [Morchella snyderi]
MYRHNAPRTPETVRGYLLGNTLGAGSFGAVRKCTHVATGTECCVKVIRKDTTPREEVMAEIEILAALEGGCGLWTKLLDVEEGHPENWYIFLSLAHGGDLFALYESQTRLSPFRIKEILYDIAKALQELHERSIVHRDIKPDNILLSTRTSSARALLADFGVSSWCDGRRMLDGRCGTARYMAPEMCARLSDMWSFGLLAYILVFGKPLLPEGADDDATMQLTAALRPGFLKNTEGHSPDAFTFIKALLHINPYNRLTAHAAVNHPYLRAARLKRERETMLQRYSPAALEARLKEEKRLRRLRERLEKTRGEEETDQSTPPVTAAAAADMEAAAQRGWDDNEVEIKQEQEEKEDEEEGDVWMTVGQESVRERERSQPAKRRCAIPRPRARAAVAMNNEAGPMSAATATTAIAAVPLPAPQQMRRMVYRVGATAPHTATNTNTNINITTTNNNNNGPLINLSSTPASSVTVAAAPAPRAPSGIPRITGIPRFTGGRPQGGELSSPSSSPPVDGDFESRYDDVFLRNFRIEAGCYRGPAGGERKDWVQFSVAGPRL